MIPTPPASAPPGRSLPAVRARRCVRHPAREAAAQCRECGGPFCRECVSEHEGRLVCAPCLARLLKPTETAKRRGFGGVMRAAKLAAGVLVLWLCFYWLGSLLTKIPVEFHEGTIWREAAKRLNP